MTNPYTRTPEQEEAYRLYRESQSHIPCVFCDYYVLTDQLIEAFKYHKLLYNKFPYPNAETHYLIVPNRHITKLSEMTDVEWMEHSMIKRMLLNKHVDAGDLTRAESDPQKSVEHLHTHIIVWNFKK